MDLLAAPLTYALLAANIIASLIAFGDERFLTKGLFIVGPILGDKQYYRMISSGFLHGSQTHLFINMITLFFFGPSLEGILGTVLFAAVYFISLLGGSLWSLMENRRNPRYSALGASGAISGVLISFSLFAPFSTLLLFFVLPMPAIVFTALYISYSMYASVYQKTSRIGHDAHLGGALAGGLATILLVPGVWGGFIMAIEKTLGLG